MNLETFQMIQDVVEIDHQEQKICCSAVVPLQSTIFDYHFPDFPILPGVILTETVAQAAGYLSLLSSDFSTMAFFFGIDKVKFREFVLPGDELIIHCQRTHQGSGYSAYSGTIHTQSKLESQTKNKTKNKKCIEAQIRLKEMPFPNEKMKLSLKSHVHRCLNKENGH